MSTDHDRIATLEREHADVLRRVEMLSDEISHAIASMRLQSTQLVASAEAQRSLSDGWQAARNHNEVLTQRLARCEQEWGGNAYLEYCRGATDTTIYCRFLVAVGSAP